MVLDAASNHSNVVRYERMQRGAYFADFRRDKRLDPEVYHCIVQREGSTEILRWTQHRTLEEAIQTAEVELTRLGSQQGTEQELSAQES